MFQGKAGAYMSETPERCSTLGLGPASASAVNYAHKFFISQSKKDLSYKQFMAVTYTCNVASCGKLQTYIVYSTRTRCLLLQTICGCNLQM
jgi:hypothetical protein